MSKSPSYIGPITTDPGATGNEVPDRQDIDDDFVSKAAPKLESGANKAMGRATLVGGTVTVANTLVTADSNIIPISQVDGGTPGWLRISARTVGQDFTILSSSGTDTSEVAWVIIEPNA